jgi:hypothetical protein
VTVSGLSSETPRAIDGMAQKAPAPLKFCRNARRLQEFTRRL